MIMLSASSRDGAFMMLVERLRPAFTLTLLPLERGERGELVREHLKSFGKTLSESAFENQLRLVTTKRAAGSPLYLILVCEELRLFPSYEQVGP